MNWRIHLITFFVFLFALGTVKFVWSNPKVILYFILALICLLAYGALYIIVKAKVDGSERK